MPENTFAQDAVLVRLRAGLAPTDCPVDPNNALESSAADQQTQSVLTTTYKSTWNLPDDFVIMVTFEPINPTSDTADSGGGMSQAAKVGKYLFDRVTEQGPLSQAVLRGESIYSAFEQLRVATYMTHLSDDLQNLTGVQLHVRPGDALRMPSVAEAKELWNRTGCTSVWISGGNAVMYRNAGTEPTETLASYWRNPAMVPR
jgi:hypothetical protein